MLYNFLLVIGIILGIILILGLSFLFIQLMHGLSMHAGEVGCILKCLGRPLVSTVMHCQYSFGRYVGISRRDKRPVRSPNSSKTLKMLQRALTRLEEDPPQKNSIAFVGSSTFNYWKNLKEDMKGLQVFNGAFGGSMTIDLLEHADTICLQYEPKMIVVYCGINDVQMGARLPEDAAKTLQEFIRKTTVPVLVYGCSESPVTRQIGAVDDVSRTNALYKSICDEEDRLRFVSTNDDPRFKNKDLYLYDNLHLNNYGHQVLGKVLRPIIEEMSKSASRRAKRRKRSRRRETFI